MSSCVRQPVHQWCVEGYFEARCNQVARVCETGVCDGAARVECGDGAIDMFMKQVVRFNEQLHPLLGMLGGWWSDE